MELSDLLYDLMTAIEEGITAVGEVTLKLVETISEEFKGGQDE